LQARQGEEAQKVAELQKLFPALAARIGQVEERASATSRELSKATSESEAKLTEVISGVSERVALAQSQITSQEIMLFDLREEELKSLAKEVEKRPTLARTEFLINKQNNGPELQLEVLKLRKDQELLLKVSLICLCF